MRVIAALFIVFSACLCIWLASPVNAPVAPVMLHNDSTDHDLDDWNDSLNYKK
jgi:hypothetical protein